MRIAVAGRDVRFGYDTENPLPAGYKYKSIPGKQFTCVTQVPVRLDFLAEIRRDRKGCEMVLVALPGGLLDSTVSHGVAPLRAFY